MTLRPFEVTYRPRKFGMVDGVGSIHFQEDPACMPVLLQELDPIPLLDGKGLRAAEYSSDAASAGLRDVAMKFNREVDGTAVPRRVKLFDGCSRYADEHVGRRLPVVGLHLEPVVTFALPQVATHQTRGC